MGDSRVQPSASIKGHAKISMYIPLLIAQDSSKHVHLIVGSNSIASTRCTKSIEVGARPKIIAPADANLHHVLRKRIEDGEVEWIQRSFEEEDLRKLGRDEVDNVVDAVFVTIGSHIGQSSQISNLCRRLRIPVNVTDAPKLCTFTLLSTYSDGPLQVGITTSGRGCKLASRIRREIASSLPSNLGSAVERLGTLRRRIWEEDHRLEGGNFETEDDDSTAQKANFNQLITESDQNAVKSRRIRWLSQICEYWPLRHLAAITDSNIETILQSYSSTIPHQPPSTTIPDLHTFPKPQIILAGSGPGSPSLLTLVTYRAIQNASLILADKLVPAPVLDLIPRRTPVHIARKFPGNADAAQVELLSLGLAALQKGHSVLRLKQGDPYIYGRGAEEYTFFKENGFTPVVLPGITSALSAPLFAAIPSTHRSVADQVLICTGTGRKGAAPNPPPYVPSQTVVFLMSLHRLPSLIESLTNTTADHPPPYTDHQHPPDDLSTPQKIKPNSNPWPLATPCAVIERASCPDQRVVRSTLQHVCAAVEEEGSRPPGLLVVGWSCNVLMGKAGEPRWVVEEGFAGFEGLDQSVGLGAALTGMSVGMGGFVGEDERGGGPRGDVAENES